MQKAEAMARGRVAALRAIEPLVRAAPLHEDYGFVTLGNFMN
ncbi:MAG: hypothetical protein ACR2FI_03140 [Burkholderiales bacterium]